MAVLVSSARRREIKQMIAAAIAWAHAEPTVRALALVGSWSRGTAGPDSDLDLIVLSRAPADLLDRTDWHARFGRVELVRAVDFGAITERRLRRPSGLEIEVGIGHLDWASVAPLEPGTRQVIQGGGLRILYDPDQWLARLAAGLAEGDRAQRAGPPD